MSNVNYVCQKCGEQTTDIQQEKPCPKGGAHAWGQMKRFLKNFFNRA